MLSPGQGRCSRGGNGAAGGETGESEMSCALGVPVGCATVNNIRTAISPLRVRAAALLLLLAAGLLVAGCGGSSGESSTITIGNENKADSSLIAKSESLVAKTPTTGPLSKEPTI